MARRPIAKRFEKPDRPCPVCSTHTKGCSVTDDGMHLCRSDSPSSDYAEVGQPDSLGFRHYRHESDPRLRRRRGPVASVSRVCRTTPTKGSAEVAGEESEPTPDAAPTPPATPTPAASPPPRPTPPLPPTDAAPATKAAADPKWASKSAGYAKRFGPAERSALAAALGLPEDVFATVPRLGWKPRDSSGPCWTFPMFDGTGEVCGITRRYVSPTADGKTKKAEYGSRLGIAAPMGWEEHPGPVLLVEGWSDTLAATAAGISALGRPSNKAGAKELAALLADALADRLLIVVGENDQHPDATGTVVWPGRDGADTTAAILGRMLGRDVWVGFPPGESKDIREWLTDPARGESPWADRGRDLVDALTAKIYKPCDSAEPVSPYPKPREGECWDDPYRLGNLFAAANRTPKGEPTLLHWRDEYHRWQGGAWLPVADGDITAEVARHCRAVFEADYPERKRIKAAQEKDDGSPPVLYRVSGRIVSDSRLNIAAAVNLPDRGEVPPLWIGGTGDRPDPTEVISAPNGLYTLDDIADGKPSFASPTPALFTANALPFAVPQSAPTPATWLRCLDEWFAGDESSIDGLQEWAGYLLTANTATQKILMLVGPPRSGKGSILRVLTAIVGIGNVSSTSFSRLGDQFGLQPLLGKRVAIIPDCRLSGKTDTATVVERLLSISGGDLQSVNRKNLPMVDSYLNARFVLATNEVPRLPDASGAVASRFHILRTPNSFLGREDKGLGAKLDAELPGILLWAAAGWKRLKANGLTFTANDAASEYRRELDDLSSPIKAFMRERCLIGPEHEVDVQDLYSSWCEWNEIRKRGYASEQIFGRDLRAALPQLRDGRPRRAGCRVRTYIGIGLRPREEWGDDPPEVVRSGPRTTPLHVERKSFTHKQCSNGSESSGCNGVDRGPSRTTLVEDYGEEVVS